MDDSARDDGEIFEATVFLHHFEDLTDPRQQAKVVYPLDEGLLLGIAGHTRRSGVRIPTHGGHRFQSDRGRPSDLMAASVPI